MVVVVALLAAALTTTTFADARPAPLLDRLRARRSEAVDASGLAPDVLRRLLATDPTVRVHPSGRAYVDEPRSPEAGPLPTVPYDVLPGPLAFLSAVAGLPNLAVPELSLPPLGLGHLDVPSLPDLGPPAAELRLHSRPGSSRVLYLDFDGELLTGTAWADGNPVLAEPFDTDGFPLSFSPSELATVAGVWQRVAEDYSAFDIDVTTQDPGVDAITRTDAADTRFGSRVLITSTNQIYTSCACGGRAFIGAFDHYSAGPHDHAYFQPALVFQRGVGSSARILAEAASHEAGHLLGLSHDGGPGTAYAPGNDRWSPIMGLAYYRPLTQWSRGEYQGATNLEDDFAVLASHGAPLLADDHGDTPAAATPLGTGSFEASGRIGTGGDSDLFVFDAAAGPVTITAAPSPVGPNLDIRLELLDVTGRLVAAADPPSAALSDDLATGLDAHLDTVVATGRYYLRVDGTGVGDPATDGYSDYGSVGPYTLRGSVVARGENSTPVAIAAATPLVGPAPLAVDFDSTGSSDPDGTIVAVAWAYGDGATADVDATHVFDEPGTYPVTLTVVDSDGATGTATVTIVVEGPAAPPPLPPG